jgi:hypothetical protein
MSEHDTRMPTRSKRDNKKIPQNSQDILDKAQSKKFGLRQSLGIEKLSSG